MIRHYTHDQRVIVAPTLAWTLCLKGKVNEAKTLISKEPLPNLQHAASRAFFLCICSHIYQFTRDFTNLKFIAEELSELSKEYGYFYWGTWALICHGLGHSIFRGSR